MPAMQLRGLGKMSDKVSQEDSNNLVQSRGNGCRIGMSIQPPSGIDPGSL